MSAFSSNRIVIDWDEIEANGPYCGSEIAIDAWPPPTGLLAEVVAPFMRTRARYRQILAAGVIRSLPRLTGWQKDLAWKITTTSERNAP